VVIPPVLTALISIGLFFYDEIFLDLAILASRGQQ